MRVSELVLAPKLLTDKQRRYSWVFLCLSLFAAFALAFELLLGWRTGFPTWALWPFVVINAGNAASHAIVLRRDRRARS